MEETISEAAKIFLKQFSEILEDFKKETGFQVFLLNRKGELINELEGVQPACKMILSSHFGKIRCKDSFKLGFLVVKKERKPIFLRCYAGFGLSLIPIIVRGSFIGAVIICGGDYGEKTQETLKKDFSKLAEELGIFEKEKFLKLATEETKIINENEMKKETEKLQKLIDILTENVQTPLKEIFG
jgi:ligand-binding sensor protein